MDWKLYLEENLNNFKEDLLKIGFKAESKRIERRKLHFVPLKASFYQPGQVKIRRSDLINLNKFEKIFTKLCEEGRSWIHLNIIGIADDFLIMDFIAGDAVGHPKPPVMYGGPSVDMKGKRKRQKIVLV